MLLKHHFPMHARWRTWWVAVFRWSDSDAPKYGLFLQRRKYEMAFSKVFQISYFGIECPLNFNFCHISKKGIGVMVYERETQNFAVRIGIFWEKDKKTWNSKIWKKWSKILTFCMHKNAISNSGFVQKHRFWTFLIKRHADCQYYSYIRWFLILW